ncbi:MAG: apolipoprotein N-acyltransferase [Planctomycetaceae bacterium]
MSDAARLRSLALGGAATMFLVQPPADLWLLAWLAPLPWLGLVQAPDLPGRRPWLALWIAGFAHWLATIHWLRLPHPATAVGWAALSAYLAGYVPLFVWLARRLVHRWRWPLVAAAPVAWMASEHLRGTLLGGFTFGGLGHTQWRWTALIQCADAAGAVGVSGVVMAAAAGVAAVATGRRGGSRRAAIGEVACTAAVVAVALAYGQWRIATSPAPRGEPLDVLLVQGSIDTELKHDPDAAVDVARHYDEVTMRGLAADPARRPDLVVWPETMWRLGLLEVDPAAVFPESEVEAALGPAAESPAESPADRQRRYRTLLERQRLEALAPFAARYGTTWLVGLDRQRIRSTEPPGWESFNAALFLEAAGKPLACYDKMHPVMFGEYVPFADRFPFLYRLTPLPGGLTAGRRPVAVEIAGRHVAPTICYETALPGAIRSLVRTLEVAGERPDVIVNLTNDGWFWGSSELDMHLVASVFRAVEVRTPIVIAANTGFSAAIDGCGRLLARGPRRAVEPVRVRVRPDGRRSPWLAAGSVAPGACMAVAGAVLLEALVRGLARRRGTGGHGNPPAGLRPADPWADL